MIASMNRLSQLRLAYEVTENPDWPEVRIYVDGEDPFDAVAPGWRGFDPADILGAEAPLEPPVFGRRVAVRRCSCGEAGCGVIAPRIGMLPDRSEIVWSDFCDYTGVFNESTVASEVSHPGRPWALSDIHFEPHQYLAEVSRASSDLSWETRRRTTARLVHAELSVRGLTVPGGRLGWVVPAFEAEGVIISYFVDHPSRRPEQVLLHLSAGSADPLHAAREIVGTLAARRSAERADRFRWERPSG